MTAPVTTAAAPVAPATPGVERADPASGERFAAALGDAVAGGRGDAADPSRTEDAEAPAGGDPAADGLPSAPEGAVPVAAMPPALWVLFPGGAPGDPGATVPATAAAVDGVPSAAPAPVVAAPAEVPTGGIPSAATLTATAPPGASTAELPVRTAARTPTDVAPSAGAPVSGPAPVPAAASALTAALPGLTVVVAGPAAGSAEAPQSSAPALAAPQAAVAPAPSAVAPAPPAGAPSADAGTTPEQESGDPAPAGTVPAAPAPAPAASVPAPGSTATPAAAPVGTQVAAQVAVLRHGPDGAHTMTVVLTPETLGPVEVQVTLVQGSVELTLRGSSEAGRAALLDALPDLRRDLQSAGLACSNATVDRDTDGTWTSAQQHAAGDRPGQQGQPDGRARPWLRTHDLDAGRPVPVATTTAASGLDVRV